MLYLLSALPWALCFLLGACFFSFLNVVVWRLPRREPVVRGRSHCPVCGRTLRFWELVPCLSFLALGGRCRSCGAGIPIRDFGVECLGGAAAVGCILRFGLSPRAFLSFGVLWLLTAVALMDYDTMEIYDRFHAGLILCALLSLPLFPEVSLAGRAIGCLCVSLPMLALALAVPGGFGGGDIKLMFALGLLLGWKNTLLAAFLAILSGGCYAAVLLLRGRAGRKSQFAFGPFLCLGGAAALLYGGEILAWYTAFW